MSIHTHLSTHTHHHEHLSTPNDSQTNSPEDNRKPFTPPRLEHLEELVEATGFEFPAVS
jgi:hypothetical protein